MIAAVDRLTDTRPRLAAGSPAVGPRAAAAYGATRADDAAGPAAVQALRSTQALGRRADPHDPVVLRATAAQMAAELFLKPLLAEVRRFPLGGELADGGQTEAVFGEQLDQRIADGVAAAERGLLRAMVRELQPRATRTAASSAAPVSRGTSP